jgi:putative oxidoreductase
MRKLFSSKYSAGAFNAAMLFLRLAFGILMMNHGYQKLLHFADKQHSFMNFLGMGSTLSLLLVIFAEFFCALFIILGLFTIELTVGLIITICLRKWGIYGTG